MKDLLNKKRIYVILAIAFLLCLWRAFKGFCWTDESFYISTADRFFKGDALLVTEWYRTQLSSVICLPFYALYRLVTGGIDGVILYFRILYLLLSLTTAVVAYKVINKDYPESVATIISVLIMFYAHLNVTSLSYYMMSLDFLLIALFMVYDYDNSKSKKKLVLAGSIFALSVLSLPSFAVAYFAALACSLVILIVVKFIKLPDYIKKYVRSKDILTIIVYTIIGIAIPAVFFVIYLFTKVSVSEIITAVPNIMVDKEHDFTFGFCIRRFFFSVSDVYGGYTKISYALIIGAFLFQKYLKKKPVANVIVLFDALLFVIYAIRSYGHTGYIQSALCLFGLPVFFLSNRKNHKMFWLYTTSGLSLAMTYSFSSSDFLYVLAIGHFVTAIGCIVFMYDYVLGQRELLYGENNCAENIVAGDNTEKGDKSNNQPKADGSRIFRILYKVSATVMSLIVLYTCCVTIGIRLSNVYRDAPIAKMTAHINHGIAEGLYTTPEHLQYYDDVYELLDEYCMADSEGNSADDTIMFSKILPWGYMCTDLKCGYPTTWRATAYNAEQLAAYYEANPGKEPDIIVVLDEQYGSYDACGDVEDDHNPNLDEMNDYWKEYIRDNGMKAQDVKCGVVYKMP